MRTLILNSTNVVADGNNNRLIYRFPSSVAFKNSSLALAQCSIYYSWFNISASLRNNYFTYTWVVGVTTTTYTVTIPDGLYEISTINKYLQYAFIANSHYLITSTGSYVYYAEFVVNPSRYAVQINTYLVPTSLPATYTAPSGWGGYPTQTFNPSITLPATFNEIVGFVAGTATDQNTNNAFTPPTSDYVSKNAIGTLSYLSTTYPNVQPNSSILFSISNIDNAYAQPTSVIYSLAPTVAIGELIVEKPANFIWNRLIPGTYNQLTMVLLGTNLNPIKINDPSMTIILVIKDDDMEKY